MIKKTLGLVLLVLGIAIICYGLYSSFSIFTAKTAAPNVFKSETQTLPQKIGQDIEAQLQDMIGEQLKGIIPTDSVSSMLNLAAWSIFAGILIFGGAQIAGLGIKLM